MIQKTRPASKSRSPFVAGLWALVVVIAGVSCVRQEIQTDLTGVALPAALDP